MSSVTTLARAATPEGLEIAYEVAGNGPAVLLLHGVSEDRSIWDVVDNDLSRDHRVVRLDFRGHGASTSVASASFDDLVTDVHAVVLTLGLQEPILVGHSLGGAVATAYAGRHPAAAVVNIEQPMRFGALAAAAKALEPRLRGSEFPAAMWDIARALGVEPVPEPMRSKLFEYRQRVSQSLLLSIWDPFFSASAESLDDLSAALVSGVRVPYLSIHGADPGSDYATWLTGLTPSAHVEVWQDLGHWVHLVAPRRCAERVRQFVGQVRAG